MCGIAGIIGSTNQVEIQLMLEPIKSRGEKKPVYKKIGNSILGNVLLEILDSDNGAQPIFNKEKTIAIVLNGEIYNYKELRSTLIEKDYVFVSDSDTEVILYLYEEYKDKLLDYLDGMFAFLIYDLKKDSYFAARDHFGIKPFYYCNNNDNFYFSSELKSFLKIGCKNFNELKPGYYIRDGKLTKWYDGLENIIINQNIDFNIAKNKIKKLITSAVKKRVATNHPIVVFFSGGIDSVIVLKLAIQFHNDVLALIIGHDDAEDVTHAIKYCNEHNIKYKQIDFKNIDLLNSIPNVIHRIETFEPNPVRGATLSYLLSKEANKLRYKIALCGEGSDEIFAGYGDFLIIDDDEFHDYQIKLIKDLHRTQLLRVDKTAMGYSLEVRVPFLDKELTEFVLSLPQNFKVGIINNKEMTKFILREAFKDDLPKYIYERKKMTLMKGAGAGKVNRGSGIFHENAEKNISDSEFINIKNSYPTYNIQDKETAFYFNIFREHYQYAKFSRKRTVNALIEINGD